MISGPGARVRVCLGGLGRDEYREKGAVRLRLGGLSTVSNVDRRMGGGSLDDVNWTRVYSLSDILHSTLKYYNMFLKLSVEFFVLFEILKLGLLMSKTKIPI